MGLLETILAWFFFLLGAIMLVVCVIGLVKAARTRDRGLALYMLGFGLVFLLLAYGGSEGIRLSLR